MSFKEELKDLNNLLKAMDDGMKSLNEMMDSSITSNYGLDLKIKDILLKKTYADIDKMDKSDILRCLNDSVTKGKGNKNISNMEKFHKKNNEFKEKDFEEYAKYVFKDIRKSLNEYIKFQKEREEIKDKISKLNDNYLEYINSDEYKQEIKKKIDDMREQASNETDEIKKREINKILDTIDKSQNSSFLWDHIIKSGTKKEIENTKNIFFNKTRSNLIIDKFLVKIKSLGYPKDIYKKFFNIEEMFLPEQYHFFNNLFLFHVMRTIAYFDSNNKNDIYKITSILNKIYKLVYHKYDTKAEEDEFIEIIKKFDDMFIEYIDYFKENNQTHPNHPDRLHKEKEFDQKKRMMLISAIENRGHKAISSGETLELESQLKNIIKQENIDIEKAYEEPVDENAGEITSEETD